MLNYYNGLSIDGRCRRAKPPELVDYPIFENIVDHTGTLVPGSSVFKSCITSVNNVCLPWFSNINLIVCFGSRCERF